MPENLPDLMSWITAHPALTDAIFMALGLLIATRFAGPFIGRLMRGFAPPGEDSGLANAGRMIGYLERSVIYLMILLGEPSGIGFLIAAKSVARFELVSRSRAAAEYVIIGTLASFAWAILVGFIVIRALQMA